MKISATAVVLLAGLAAGAPTKTIQSKFEKRQFGTGTDGLGALASLFPTLGGGGSSTSSGLGALASLIPGLGGSSSGSGFSLPGFTLPTSIPGLGSLGSLGSSGSSGASAVPPPPAPALFGLLGDHVAKRGLLGSMTENGVKNKDACQPLTFIFARGTSELGNMGSVVGPPVATKLRSLLNNKVVVQGVDYPASVEGNALLGAAGGPTMASMVKQALSQCPDTKVVVGGYSQGAMVVHNAANSLSQGQIAAAVLFGDPFKSQAVGKVDKANVKEYCAAGDPVCLNGANVIAHLSYGSDAAEAAQFLVTASGVKA
ncbi:hypothetical protein KXV73_004525 [Aspergillus fumigatus]|nr:hypothetical protein KXV73_004525 [Aspergillus fumigatus]